MSGIVDGIVAADLHFRKDLPRCRLDPDWMKTQTEAVQTIVQEAEKRKCSIFLVGDLFHTSVVQEEIKNWFLSLFPREKTFILPGQHDLPYHQWAYVRRSSFGVLMNTYPLISSCLFSMYSPMDNFHAQAAPFGLDKDPDWTLENARIVFSHQMCFEKESDRPFPGVGKSASELCGEYPSAKWIFTGDWHKGFYYHNQGTDQHVINPGCLTRQASDFIDYQPRVYYFNMISEAVEQINIPDNGAMVTDKYIQEEKARDERIDSFVETIRKQGQVSLNFKDNLKQRLLNPQIEPDVKKVTEEIMEEI